MRLSFAAPTLASIAALTTTTTTTTSLFCQGFTPPSRRSAVAPGRRTALAATTEAPATASVFLTAETTAACVALAGSPTYAYSLPKLQDAVEQVLAFPNLYGLTVRYAMKACPNAAILKYFSSQGIHMDASSGFEVQRALSAGIPPEHISLSTQELPANFPELIQAGVNINAWYVL